MRPLLTAVLIALVARTTVTSAAKCFYRGSKTPDVVHTPGTDPFPAVDFKGEQGSVSEDTSDKPEVSSPTPPEDENSDDAGKQPDGSAGIPPSSEEPDEEPEEKPEEPKSSGDTPSPSGNSTDDGHAPFGDITSGDDKCVIGNPSEYIATKDVNWIWTERIAKGSAEFKNYIIDQIVSNKGKLSYCVRWDSTEKLSKEVASKFEPMLNRQFKAWNHWLVGYGCWPYETIDVKIVGWATRDAALFDWSDDSLGEIHSTEKDVDGVPQCPENCYKHKDSAAHSDTSGCKSVPFDMSLWPTLGQGGGAGGDWGQRADAHNMLASLDLEQLTIVSHEMGHGFGLPDFYKPEEEPSKDFPVCIMKAGSAHEVTPADGWMLRRVYENLRPRYDFG